MKLLGLVICALICTAASADQLLQIAQRSVAPRSGPGHYWRDDEGRIPDDAYEVEKNIYVAQVLTNKVLVPAQLTAKPLQVVYTYEGTVYTTKNYYKVLCTTDSTQFRWIKTDNDAIKPLLPVTTFVEGGADDGYPLFVGRSIQGKLVGKVTIYYKYAGLAYVRDGMHQHDYQFEVMAYK